MKIDTQRYLKLCEQTNQIAFWDIECTGLRGDYNTIVCVSIKPFGKKPRTYVVDRPGNDKKVVTAAARDLEQFHIWSTYYGKGFDVPMLQTRLLKWNVAPLIKQPHLDMYYFLKSHILTARRSMAHLSKWLHTDQQKMDVAADVWSDLTPKNIKILIERCESDTIETEDLYKRTKHLIVDINR